VKGCQRRHIRTCVCDPDSVLSLCSAPQSKVDIDLCALVGNMKNGLVPYLGDSFFSPRGIFRSTSQYWQNIPISSPLHLYNGCGINTSLFRCHPIYWRLRKGEATSSLFMQRCSLWCDFGSK